MKKAKTTLANLSGLGALRLARDKDEAESPEEAPAERRVQRREVTPAEEAPRARAVPVARPPQQPRPVGRPRTGKRSDANFRNVTVYIRKDTHADADEILRRRRRKGEIAEGEPRDVSELVQDLLAEWVAERRGK